MTAIKKAFHKRCDDNKFRADNSYKFLSFNTLIPAYNLDYFKAVIFFII